MKRSMKNRPPGPSDCCISGHLLHKQHASPMGTRQRQACLNFWKIKDILRNRGHRHPATSICVRKRLHGLRTLRGSQIFMSALLYTEFIPHRDFMPALYARAYLSEAFIYGAADMNAA